jgi:predicted transcriptional regulator YheO
MALYGPGGLMKFRWDPNLTYEEKLRVHKRLMAENGEYAVRAPAFTEEEKAKARRHRESSRQMVETLREEGIFLFRSGN